MLKDCSAPALLLLGREGRLDETELEDDLRHVGAQRLVACGSMFSILPRMRRSPENRTLPHDVDEVEDLSAPGAADGRRAGPNVLLPDRVVDGLQESSVNAE